MKTHHSRLAASHAPFRSALRKSFIVGSLIACSALLPTESVLAQGYYYEVSSMATTTTGSVYNFQPYIGVPVYNLIDSFVRQAAPSGTPMTIFTPTPAGYTTPTNAVFEAAVNQTALAIFNGAPIGQPDIPSGLGALAVAAMQYSPGDGLGIGVQISKVIASQYTTSGQAGLASTAVTTIVDALAATNRPGDAAQMIRGLVATDSTGFTALGTAALNTGGAHVIADLVKEAILTIKDPTAVATGQILNYGINGIVSAKLDPNATTNAALKKAAYVDPVNGLIPILVVAAGDNQGLVSNIIKNSLVATAVAIVTPTGSNAISSPTSSVGQILSAATSALHFFASPTAGSPQDRTNQYNLIALTDGALASSQGGVANANSIATVLATFSNVSSSPVGGPAYSNYTNAVASGYQNATAALFPNYFTSNPSNVPYAAAVASGAVTNNAGLISTIVQYSLLAPGASSGTSATTQDVLFASVLASPASVAAAITGAINPNSGNPYVYGMQPVGLATAVGFGDVARGAFQAGTSLYATTTMSTLFGKLGAFVTSGAGFAPQVARVQDVVTGAVVGGDASNNNRAAVIADAIYTASAAIRNYAGYAAPTANAGVTAFTATTNLGPASDYLAAVAALAGDQNGNRTLIINATYGAGGPVTDKVAALAGGTLVANLQDNYSYANIQHNITLAAFASANTSNAVSSLTADLYAAVLANRTQPIAVDAALAAAIKQVYQADPSVSAAAMTKTASDLLTGFSNNTAAQALAEVGKVASQAKANALSPTVQVLPYVGTEVATNPTLTNDIATAWTVVDPDHAHYVATAVAFNSPANASGSVQFVFRYAQITNATPYAQPRGPSGTAASGLLTAKSFPGTLGTIIDQPAAAAAITAGYVSGILQSDPTFRFGVSGTASTATVNNLKSTVAQAVIASVIQGNVNLQGPSPTVPVANSNAVFNDYSYLSQPHSFTYQTYFRQNNGLGISNTDVFTSSTGNPFQSNRTTGAAGAVTGFVAQLTYLGDTTISATTTAVLTSAANSARQYGLQIAQAAAQAFAWVSAGPSANSVFAITPAAATNQTPGNVVYDIAEAVLLGSVTNYNTGVGSPSLLQQLMNAAYFGITEANNGTIGAGALGLNATGLTNGTLKIAPVGNAKSDFYQHASVTGTPVTNIFNL